jgi:hypothetical protein
VLNGPVRHHARLVVACAAAHATVPVRALSKAANELNSALASPRITVRVTANETADDVLDQIKINIE